MLALWRLHGEWGPNSITSSFWILVTTFSCFLRPRDTEHPALGFPFYMAFTYLNRPSDFRIIHSLPFPCSLVPPTLSSLLGALQFYSRIHLPLCLGKVQLQCLGHKSWLVLQTTLILFILPVIALFLYTWPRCGQWGLRGRLPSESLWGLFLHNKETLQEQSHPLLGCGCVCMWHLEPSCGCEGDSADILHVAEQKGREQPGPCWGCWAVNFQSWSHLPCRNNLHLLLIKWLKVNLHVICSSKHPN